MNSKQVTEVVIVTYNSARHIGPCLDSIRRNGATAIVVDNGSQDTTEQIVRGYEEAQFVPAGGNLGYGKSINLGFQRTTGEFVVLSNPDIVYAPGSIEVMVEYLRSHPEAGIVGAQQTFPDGSWQRSYGDLPSIGSGLKDAMGYTSLQHWIRRLAWPRKLDRKPKEVPYVDGGVLVVRRTAFEEMGGFDELFYFYADESDLCARMHKAGWKVVFVPSAQVIHARGGDSMKVDRSDKFLRYLVTSKVLLAERYIPGWRSKVYAWLEAIYFLELAFVYRVLWVIRSGVGKNRISDKIWTLNSCISIWREYIMTGTISRSYR
jgi:N-acetylglucosaminyl-diphospho-decaprenol L-rhamnosyltransferase